MLISKEEWCHTIQPKIITMKVNPFLILGLIVVVSVHLRIGSTLHGSMRMKQLPRGVKTLSQIHAASRHRWGVGSGTIRQISGKNLSIVGAAFHDRLTLYAKSIFMKPQKIGRHISSFNFDKIGPFDYGT